MAKKALGKKRIKSDWGDPNLRMLEMGRGEGFKKVARLFDTQDRHLDKAIKQVRADFPELVWLETSEIDFLRFCVRVEQRLERLGL